MPQNEHPAAAQARRDFLRRFFHDLATPLSAVSLHLEGADRRARKGTDPTPALATARTELSKAFDLFELGRESLLEDNGPSESLDFDALVGEAAASLPGVKELVSLRIVQDVLEHFEDGGPGWQDRINEALRKSVGK